ncbi:MAG: hypothetical protein HXY49_00435 [Ignavibacteriaceae bacterium]|nr:hypothetical protein [Ignavibacteriaceae bacterium]
MNKKIRSTLGLVGLLILILVLGFGYIFLFQKSDLDEKSKKLKELQANKYDTEALKLQYAELKVEADRLDSILANRKFNIPQNLSSIKFFNFLNNVTSTTSPLIKVNTEFAEQKQDKDFFYYLYKLNGSGTFNDIYSLIYAIEFSKELKKITSFSITNLVSLDEEQVPQFLVSYAMEVRVYFSNDNRFAPADVKENNLIARKLHDAFYPLIRNEIPPNVDGLLDVQGARLLALIPEGAFLVDAKGNSYLIWEGEQVYLGYLTKIDYDNNKVSFILNKGGIIEKVNLELEREITNQKTENEP